MFETIVSVISRSGYIGIFILMFVENLFPPIPSELIMPFAGFAAARGDLNMTLVVITGTAGSVLGTLPWYYAAALLGADRLGRLADKHGRWITVSSADIEGASKRFARHGGSAVFFGRLVPAVRTVISVPAGLTKMPLVRFLIFSSAGSLIWTGLLAVSGYVLQSQYEKVARYVDPVSKTVIGIIVAIYLYRVFLQLFRKPK
jgi:membrane protein DedA with SNARE-associated domain